MRESRNPPPPTVGITDPTVGITDPTEGIRHAVRRPTLHNNAGQTDAPKTTTQP